ncbi:hypothetical protein AVEN_177304-1 [Araneus ventricosus]|uniref:Uncharacterized protein n=1 Tax=Araneus ventricosus TaxID=182803 RepID=A0A4Y2C6I9_ARAVE|nr:hypothetical protein AVEN_177304-1 [Araneus ventricosus]
MENFSASHDRVEKFKNMHGLAACFLSGESTSVNEGTVQQWKEDFAYLVDETGFIYKLMPDRTVTFKGEQCHDGKECKERLTVLLCCNADGSEKFRHCEFIDADENLITVQLRQIGNIAAEINGGEEDEEEGNDDEDDAVDEGIPCFVIPEMKDVCTPPPSSTKPQKNRDRN